MSAVQGSTLSKGLFYLLVALEMEMQLQELVVVGGCEVFE